MWQLPHCPRGPKEKIPAKKAPPPFFPRGSSISLILEVPSSIKELWRHQSDAKERAKQDAQAGALENMKCLHLSQINMFMSPQTYKKQDIYPKFNSGNKFT